MHPRNHVRDSRRGERGIVQPRSDSHRARRGRKPHIRHAARRRSLTARCRCVWCVLAELLLECVDVRPEIQNLRLCNTVPCQEEQISSSQSVWREARTCRVYWRSSSASGENARSETSVLCMVSHQSHQTSRNSASNVTEIHPMSRKSAIFLSDLHMERGGDIGNRNLSDLHINFG